MYAYAHATLDDETFKMTSFSSGDELFVLIREFYAHKGLPKIFKQRMFIVSKKFFYQGSALVKIDDILLVSIFKPYILQLFKQLHDIGKNKN